MSEFSELRLELNAEELRIIDAEIQRRTSSAWAEARRTFDTKKREIEARADERVAEAERKVADAERRVAEATERAREVMFAAADAAAEAHQLLGLQGSKSIAAMSAPERDALLRRIGDLKFAERWLAEARKGFR